MPNIEESPIFFKQLLVFRERSDRILSELINTLPFNNSNLVTSMRYGALLGGKRLRPFLVYTIGQMFGITLNNLDAPAAAVECIHAYSLIHDDLPAMDNDNLRRGQSTCHIKFGEATAILAGDALQALAFSILADAEMPDVALSDRLSMISELATSSGIAGMCGGQSMDLEAEGKKIGLEILEQIHCYKTGSLIRASIRLGAIAAGNCGRSLFPLLDRYATAVGLAFQVQDDILDVIGETEKIGKHKGADQQHCKITYPALLGLNKAQAKAWELYEEAVSALNALAELSYDTSLLRALANFIVKRDN
ncbi:geranyltranstransferase [Serratia symbiotica str. 'Cinara cedri']|nr:geranyltranstransferase [Serratia symbiotica str. 'Cinara cedri']